MDRVPRQVLGGIGLAPPNTCLQLTKRPALRTGRRGRLDLAFHALHSGSAALQLKRQH
jgi:hypothetical protein